MLVIVAVCTEVHAACHSRKGLLFTIPQPALWPRLLSCSLYERGKGGERERGREGREERAREGEREERQRGRGESSHLQLFLLFLLIYTCPLTKCKECRDGFSAVPGW